MHKDHHYSLTNEWQGNTGQGTLSVSAYNRTHLVRMDKKPDLILTTDNALYGDKTKLNPEDLMLTSISSCHMLSYLYLCSIEGVIVTSYSDNASALMREEISGAGKFIEAILKPRIQVENESMIQKAIDLHHKAHEICYIANSVNFEIKCLPEIFASNTQ